MTAVFREAFPQEGALTCAVKAEQRVKERRVWWEQGCTQLGQPAGGRSE